MICHQKPGFCCVITVLLIAAIVLIAGCSNTTSDSGTSGTVEESPAGQEESVQTPVDRESLIPADQEKMTPENDLLPPVLHSHEYEEPVPMPYPVNTAGAEDSGFMMPDGDTFYVWFTPDPNAPLEDQLDDGVTAIYEFHKVNGTWQKPQKVVLQDPDRQSLDGCEFIMDDTMWFCSARTGYTGLHWFQAHLVDGEWGDVRYVAFDSSYEVGELHITADGKELYFHSSREGGKGGYDIWVSEKIDGKWGEPQNVEAVNSPETDGWPSLNRDATELWFTRTYMGSPAIFRSKRIDGEWQEPELIISQFAGESSIDNDGNIYFTHHFYKDGVMLEADIYVAYRK